MGCRGGWLLFLGQNFYLLWPYFFFSFVVETRSLGQELSEVPTAKMSHNSVIFLNSMWQPGLKTRMLLAVFHGLLRNDELPLGRQSWAAGPSQGWFLLGSHFCSSETWLYLQCIWAHLKWPVWYQNFSSLWNVGRYFIWKQGTCPPPAEFSQHMLLVSNPHKCEHFRSH